MANTLQSGGVYCTVCVPGSGAVYCTVCVPGSGAVYCTVCVPGSGYPTCVQNRWGGVHFWTMSKSKRLFSRDGFPKCKLFFAGLPSLRCSSPTGTCPAPVST